MSTPDTKQQHWFGPLLLTLRAFLVIGLQCYSISLIERYHDEAVRGRKAILAMETHNEEMLNQHMLRTVERWELLQKHNPHLDVKQIPEPVQ